MNWPYIVAMIGIAIIIGFAVDTIINNYNSRRP